MKTTTQYLFLKTIGKFFCFLGLYISLIVNSQAAGFVDVSVLSVSPSPVTIGQNFNISFSLKEYQGDSKTFEYIDVWIQDQNRSDLYNAKRWDNIAFSANQSQDFSATTFLDPAIGRRAGEYYVVIRGKLAGSVPFDFGVVPESNATNPHMFSALPPLVGWVQNTFAYIRPLDTWCVPASFETLGIVGIRSPFEVNFDLNEIYGGNKQFEYIEIWIQDGSGNDLYRVEPIWTNEQFSANQHKRYTVQTFLDPAKGRTPGLYHAAIRGKVLGDNNPFNFNEAIHTPPSAYFNAVQRDGKLNIHGWNFFGFEISAILDDDLLKIRQSQYGYATYRTDMMCGVSMALEYVEMWVQDNNGRDLWRIGRWDNLNYDYQEQRDFRSDIFIDPAKYKLGIYQIILRGKIAGTAPFDIQVTGDLIKFQVIPAEDNSQTPPPAKINRLTPLDGGFSISGTTQAGAGTSVVKFVIESTGNNGSTTTYEAIPEQDGSFSKIILGLTNGFRYLVKVFAEDAVQVKGPASASVSVTPQAAPQDAKDWGKNLPPVLLLHGWNSDGSVWEYVLKKFRDADVRVQAPTFSGVNDNLCEEAVELRDIIKNSGASKVIVIGHSQGGLVARAYMQFGAKPEEFYSKLESLENLNNAENACGLAFNRLNQFFDSANSDIAALITYGTPHDGVDELPAAIARPPLVMPGSNVLNFLNDFNEFPLPTNLPIINLIGRTSSLGTGDCVVSAVSQDMRTVGYRSNDFDYSVAWGRKHSPACGLLTGTLHWTIETNDAETIEKEGLKAPIIQFHLHSPADLIVVDPESRTVSKDKREIWGATYEEQTDETGHTTDVVYIPFPSPGTYQVTVISDPDAAPTDTFSVDMELSGVKTPIVGNMPIQNIPKQPFTVTVDITPDPFVFFNQIGVARNSVINSNLITVNGINQPAAINILGGEYSINGAAYTSVPNLVNNGDTVSVRHTSAATYNTATDTMLSIGGYSAVFTSATALECVSTPALKVTLSPSQLWPPNHKMVTVTANVQVSDTCDPKPTVTLVSITSNEADKGLGDGDTANDIQNAAFGTDDRSLALRAERSGTGTGRIYTITYKAKNAQGKVSTAVAQVVVPHDQGK